jgi:hypothetical protein
MEPEPVLKQAKGIQFTASQYLSEIHFNSSIINPSMPRSPKLSLPFMFSAYSFVHICHLSPMCYMSHPTSLDHLAR